MRKVLFSVFISASLLCTTAFASVSDDQVTSQKIKEADGTSGQNTNSGSGIKTGHIQDGAVTSAKIATGTVTNGNIASGAVTDAKISGVISVTKLPVGSTADTVASGNHNHDSVYQKKYANVVVVAKSGGDFTDPIAAINSITNASAENPYLLKIMPGIYDLGSSTLYMKEYVDIEGAGETVTSITSTVTSYNFSAGTVNGASNAELRFLTVQNTGYTGSTTAIANNGYVSVKLSHIRVLVTNSGTEYSAAVGISGVFFDSVSLTDSTIQVVGGSGAIGITMYRSSGYFPFINNVNISVTTTLGGGSNTGISSEGGLPIIENVTVSASGPSQSSGIVITRGDSVLTNVTATASGSINATGVYLGNNNHILRNVTATAVNSGWNIGLGNGDASVFADRSTFEGSSYSIYDSGGSAITKIGASKLVGVTYGGGFTCVASYDGNYAPLGANCQ